MLVCGVTYSNSASGYTVLIAAGTATVNISGSYATETNYDYVRIYSGVGTSGTLLASYSGSGSINYTGAAGQTLTVQFTSDGSVTSSGLNANVTYGGSCSAGGACNHTLELSDTYGDGWNGGSVNLYVGGTLIGNYTLASGYGPNVINFSAISGQAIQVTYTSGSWAYENYFSVKNGSGAALVSNWYPSSSGTWNGTASCSVTPPANDACANAIAIGSSLPYTSAIISNANATNDSPVSACDGPYKNVWWTVTGICGTMTANTCTGNTNFDSEIAVFTGSCGNMTAVACNDDGCGVQSTVTWNSTSGTVYYISVGSYSSSSATGNLQLNVTATANTLSTQPTSISGTSTVCGGISTTLTAVGGTDGTGASYEWFSGSCGGTAAGTGVSITVAPTATTTYFVRRTGTCNTTPCASQTVTVNAPSASTPTALSSGDYVWSGNVNSDWSNASNWLVFNGNTYTVAAAVPSSTTNVYIRGYASCATNAATTTASSSVSCNSLTIESGKSLIMGSSATINVYGNWIDNGAFTPNTATVAFVGSQAQSVKSGGSSFYNVIVNNTTTGNSDINITDPMVINNIATFTDGIMYFSGTGSLSFTNGAVCPNGGSASCFVNTVGTNYVSKTGTNAFIFPVGEISSTGLPIWAPIAIAAPALSSTITANYNFSTSPNNWDPSLMCDLNVIDHTSGVEHWLLTTTASSPAVTLYWKNGSRSGITSPSDLNVAHWESCNGINKWVSKGGTVTGNASSGSITSTVAFNSYSPVTFGTKVGTNPLPVSLLNFSVSCGSDGVDAFWSTASETNNDFFTLEKSSDMKEWDIVQVVPGAGNSNTILDYSTTDKFTNAGTMYYRLKQTDFDGQFTYSKIVTSDCQENAAQTVSVYPNPAQEYVNIEISVPSEEQITVNVYNTLGRLVISKEMDAQNTAVYRIDLDGLSAGTYKYTVVTSNETFNGQFVKVNSGR